MARSNWGVLAAASVGLAVGCASHAHAQGWGSGTMSASLASGAGGNAGQSCDPKVAEVEHKVKMDNVDGLTKLAQSNYTYLPPEGFTGLGCLDRLLRPGINLMFAPPSLPDLLNRLASGVCNIAQQKFQSLMRPLNESMSKSLPVGEVIPGVNLGSLGGMVSVSSATNANGLIQTNAGSAINGFNQNGFGALSGRTGYYTGYTSNQYQSYKGLW
jgi:hypothetical protein